MSAAAMLVDDDRLHLQHGPIDLIILAEGAGNARQHAFAAAAKRFETVLSVLVDELDFLRNPVSAESPMPTGPVARRMMEACRPHALKFVTPMAAVAGAVADEVLAAMVAATPLNRAAVNNGGDIAIHLSRGEPLTIDIAAQGSDGRRMPLTGGSNTVRVDPNTPVRAIATSGRGGRSLSFGIADAVTVLARSAAEADVAATLITNAVDLPNHPAISRAPANEVRDDSDLGDKLVVTGCASLVETDIDEALAHGAEEASRMREKGLIEGAALFLQGKERTI